MQVPHRVHHISTTNHAHVPQLPYCRPAFDVMRAAHGLQHYPNNACLSVNCKLQHAPPPTPRAHTPAWPPHHALVQHLHYWAPPLDIKNVANNCATAP